MNVLIKCFTCSRNDTNIKLTKATELDFDGISYLHKLRSLVGLEMEIYNDSIIQMCEDCLMNLISSYNFRENVLNCLQNSKIHENLYGENQAEHSDESVSSVISVSDSEDTSLKIENSKNTKPHADKLNKGKKPPKSSTKNPKNFVCSHCGNVFKTAFHLREHLTSHTGHKDFNCPHCEKAFPRLSSLKRHMKSHYAPPGQKTRKTPFLCTICGKNFPFSNGAARHMRIHFGVRTHECLICNKKFSQSTHLIVHMRTHSGEKPYVCENCGEKFTLKAGLRKHLKSHHKNEQFESGVVKNFCGSNIDVYFK